MNWNHPNPAYRDDETGPMATEGWWVMAGIV